MKRCSRGRTAGFTLFEIVITLALIALITGAVAPALGTMIDSKARRATRLEMESLGEGAAQYFEDTGLLPNNAQALLVSTTPGWAGPYVLGTFDDTVSGGNGYLVDAWSQPYQFAILGDVLTLTSRGKDGQAGTQDDLSLSIDVTSIRRAQTLAELKTIQIAIDTWNALYLASDPLPPSWPTIYSKLVTGGLLPPGAGYDVDAWGNAYEPDPPGVMPVTKVTSTF